jgi:hypothetical protein
MAIPLGDLPLKCFMNYTSVGATYADLEENGGASWTFEDWDQLVFIPLWAAHLQKSLGDMLPFVVMLKHLFLPMDLSCPEYLLKMLKTRQIGGTPAEILSFIRVSLPTAQSFNVLLSYDAEAALLDDAMTRCGDILYKYIMEEKRCDDLRKNKE